MILALDISVSNLGWAIGDGTAYGSEWGCKSFNAYRLDYGFLFSEYKNWLADMIDTHGITYIAVEGTYPGIKGIAGYLLNNMNGITHTTAYVMDIDRTEYKPTSVKKFTTDNGRASKEEMIAAAVDQGFSVNNDDEADAIAVLRMANHFINQKKGDNDDI